MTSDRRRSATERRRAARSPLTIAVARHAEGGTRLLQAANIGRLGMTLSYSSGEPPLGAAAQVALAFQLPDEDAVIRVRAEVVFDDASPSARVRTAGVRFAGLDPRDALRIARFVERPKS